tara:strand:+ start:2375 stop:3208 length:834 start_codon:yes stop_codon:yes gene_type:complete
MLRVLSLGAGVQSSAVFLMACRGYWEHPLDAAIFADTQFEPEVVYRWLEEVLQPEADKAGIPIYRVTAGSIQKDAVEIQVRGKRQGDRRWASMPYYTKNRETGKQAIIRRQCTEEYKIQPVMRKIRSLLGLAKGQKAKKGIQVEQWYGISADECQRMRDSRFHYIQHHYPLIFHDPPMERVACKHWLKENGFGVAPRSACIACPYHSDIEWRSIKSNPHEWDEAVKFDKAIRVCAGMNSDMFVHSSCQPLESVDLSTDYDNGQTALFGNECEGMCGV